MGHNFLYYNASEGRILGVLPTTNSTTQASLPNQYPLHAYTQNCAICTINCIYYTVFRTTQGAPMRKQKPRKPRPAARTLKYTGTKNVAAALAVNHRNQAVIVPRRTK